MFRHYKLKDYDFRLVLWVTALSILGILLVNSADSSLTSRQIFGVLLGLFLMVLFSFLDYSWVLNFYWVIYAVNLFLLTIVLFMGWASHGAQRWINLGFTTFQPVELSKILLILFFAQYLMKHEDEINTFRGIVRAAVLIAVPLLLIFLEPDLKNTITILLIFSLIYFAAGLKYRILLIILLAAGVITGVFAAIIAQPGQKLIKDYQRERIMAFFNPEDEAYSDKNTQQDNSETAIGSGMLTGKGLNNSDVSSANKGNFIPEIETDFIFAVAGEELGFVGSAGIVILLLLVSMECLVISRRAKNMAGVIICCGVASVISIQSFINIGVATGILPNTGTPLPFVSYGLSSLESLFIGIGIVLNIGLQNRVTLSEVRKASRSAGRRYEDND